MSADDAAHRRSGRLEGRCLCGEVRIVVDGLHMGGVGACHCAMCRRWSGGIYVEFVAQAEAVSVDGPVRRYASSNFAERAFCATCGGHLWFRMTEDPAAAYSLMPGLFAGAAAFPLISESHVDRAPAHAALPGDHFRETGAEYAARGPSVEGDIS